MDVNPGLAGRSWPAALAVATALVAWSPTAHAQDVGCETLDDDPNLPTIYGAGGSAGKQLIGNIAIALAAAENPIRVVYAAPGACKALDVLVGPTGTPANITEGPVYYWDADGNEHTCTLPVGGIPADWGYMAAQPESCAAYTEGIPDTIGNFLGPVSGWSIITHPNSTQTSISSEALYLVYGFGNESQAAPWTDEAFLFRRSNSSAAALAIAAASGLDVTSFLGTDVMTNQNMITYVGTATNPNAALGFVSSEVADAARDSATPVKTLAYQHRGQQCGYLPDSTEDSFDKINIRDGHYWLWAYHRFYAEVGDDGLPVNEAVATFFGHVTGTIPPTDDVPNLELIVAANTIPACAMRVGRDEDYGPLYSYQPETPCGCFFEEIATGSTECTPCTEGGSECSEGQACFFGYCEEV